MRLKQKSLTALQFLTVIININKYLLVVLYH